MFVLVGMVGAVAPILALPCISMPLKWGMYAKASVLEEDLSSAAALFFIRFGPAGIPA